MSKRAQESQAEYNTRRRQTYSNVRVLGYSPTEARTLRASPEPTIVSYVHTHRQGTPSQQRLRRSFLQRGTFRRRLPTTIPNKASRIDNFSRWSTGGIGFPKRIDQWIQEQNLGVGLSAGHHFGYRYFYHLYVEQLPDIQAVAASEGIKT